MKQYEASVETVIELDNSAALFAPGERVTFWPAKLSDVPAIAVPKGAVVACDGRAAGVRLAKGQIDIRIAGGQFGMVKEMISKSSQSRLPLAAALVARF
ncbi:hypothetical protein [Bradyrhizobium archetypum]|uniref:Uncharacterized protein n=1 Tax=Bradyrhizobium archetypum TaxID=2721160 RepID=A0A7Y4M5H8_9BRAD|nr:hypothetical protein [Bradyrhizobium archetypum]NOJ50115.1 hypothetical protein [Bradyrhizobium archetypum]